MKLIKIINPKNLSPNRLFRSKKDRSSLSRSDPSSSFSYGTASSSSSSSDASVSLQKTAPDSATPTSVLPGDSGDWSESDDLYSELAQALRLIDRDNDGLVSRAELEALLSRLGAHPPSQEEVSAMLGEVDRCGNGCISVAALTSRIGSAGEPSGDDELREAFEFFDADRDGRITAEELLGVFAAFGDERCTLEDCRRMIAHVDKNGDGFVCFEDFSRMMELQR
ncbi:hypothetical protein Tsubulata_047623 [Turnera subulata]|uniref:EF-hand domain-containing protein n=1 Tax=Turnera subulata TaxID=218843 RepID=A0A9Q0GIG4_9ROSI|nr:hypothetical protein Tsubulata_047623 [Turnera subulata]